ncbi:MAG: hypothetical protein M1827_007628 [Pycnora praestabilis]|nr:MAG: hypothetical protein M1827_007628 [Pycnora praestabilis]
MDPSSKRRRLSERSHQSNPRPERAYSTPQTRLNSSKLPYSIPRTRQQTLTQIDFVSWVVPQENDIDLNYVEEEDLPRRKRKKPQSSETLNRRATRASARGVSTGNDGGLDISSKESESENAGMPPSPSASKVKVESAITPQKVRICEVPSSQSPPETALSLRSQRSLRSLSRSPLKEKSGNVRFLPPSPLKWKERPLSHPRLLVKSSLPWENDSSEGSISSIHSDNQDCLVTLRNESATAAGSHYVCTPASAHQETPQPSTHVEKEHEEPEDLHAASSSPTAQKTAKFEIQDSADEGDEEDLETLDKHESQIGVNTDQPKLWSHGVLGDVESRAFREESSSEDERDCGQETQAVLNHIGLPSARGVLPYLGLEQDQDIHHDEQSKHVSDYGGSESQEAAAQLQGDFLQSTQLPPWPPVSHFVSSQLQPEEVLQKQQLSTSEGDSFHTTSTALVSIQQARLRPSQVSTQDITQASSHPREQAQIEAHLPSSSSLPSSSPPIPPFSTHQLSWNDSLGKSPNKEVIYDAELLTTSQLLPESLMVDSLPPPPPWTQETLDEE